MFKTSRFIILVLSFQQDQKNFFQALTICHTVQVAGDMNSNGADAPHNDKKTVEAQTKNTTKPPAAGGNGALSQIYSISDITEESNNSSLQSDVNALETSLSTDPNGVPLTPTSTPVHQQIITSDVNPLLDSSTPKVERRKRPQIVKRSPNFARSTQTRVHPMSVPPQGFEMVNGVGGGGGGERPVMFPSSLHSIPTGRPHSLIFKRSTSEVDLPEFGGTNNCAGGAAGGILGHRRSQSYGAPGAYITQSG